MVDKNQIRQYKTSKPRTIIIVYDQPKIIIVRRYTRTVVRRVNPDEYRQRFDQVLLDTATLLELTRRLNIEESMVKKSTRYLLFINSISLDYTTKTTINEVKKNKKDRWSTSM
jgi:hypothetical protein